MKKKVWILLICVVFVLGGAGAWFVGTFFRYRHQEITKKPEDLGFEEVVDEKIVNVALFGIDSREVTAKNVYRGNSDTIMVMSINTKTKKIKIISVLRDTLVPIDKPSGRTYYKINAAYSWGGPELAIKTLNQNFGLDISEYATINFYGMADIIDAIGGLDIELTQTEITIRGDNNHGINDYIEEICRYKGLDANAYYVNKAGVQHLNGVQAVAYTRMRYCPNVFGTNSDYGRTDRQRYVLQQMFNKVQGLKKTEYLKLISAMLPHLETSLSPADITGLGLRFMLSGPTFEQYRIPQNSKEMNFLMPAPKGRFGSVVYYDLAYAAKVIHAVIYDDVTVEAYVAEHPIEKNDWYRNGSLG